MISGNFIKFFVNKGITKISLALLISFVLLFAFWFFNKNIEVSSLNPLNSNTASIEYSTNSVYHPLNEKNGFNPNNPFSSNLAKSNSVGFETMDNGKVWHVWNRIDDYYFNATSGIQFSNHYRQYWTNNELCINISTVIYCLDSIPFIWSKMTDNQTFINITGYKQIALEGGIKLNVSLIYHLGVADQSLTVILKVKNYGTKNLNQDMTFVWEVNDIKISNSCDGNELEINGSTYNLKENIDLAFTRMNESYYRILGSSDFTRIDWDRNLNYFIRVKSEIGQHNAPILLEVNKGKLNAGQETDITFYWTDANYAGCLPNLCGNYAGTAGCASAPTTTCTSGNYCSGSACAKNGASGSCVAGHCAVCGDCSGSGDSCTGVTACGTSTTGNNACASPSVCSGQGTGGANCAAPGGVGSTCYCDQMCSVGTCIGSLCTLPPTFVQVNGITNGTYPDTKTISCSGSSACTLWKNATNVTAQNNTAFQLAAGLYNFTASITENQTTVWYRITPQGQSISLTGITNNTYPYSVTPICTGNVTSNLFRNYSTATNDSAIQLGVAGYLWICNTTSNSNYTFASVSVIQRVSQASRTCTLDTDKGWTRVYDGTASSTSCSVSDGSSDGSMTFTRNSSGISTPDSQTNPGGYAYACQWGAGVNYSACSQQTNTLSILKIDYSTSLTGLANRTYDGTTTDTPICTSNGTATLLRNSTSNSWNNTATVFGVAGYNWTCYVNGDATHNPSSKIVIHSITKASSTCAVLPSNQIISFDNAIIINATSSTSQLPATLWWNTTNITSQNNTAITFPAGSVNLTSSNIGNQNYTKCSQSSSTITVNQGAAVITLLLNGSSADASYTANRGANFTVVLNVSDKTVYLDSNYTGWVLQSNSPSIINYTKLTVAGTNWNLTGYFQGDQNYTFNSSTYYFNVLLVTNWENVSLSISPSASSGKYSTGVRNSIFSASLSGMILRTQSLLKPSSLSLSLQSALFKSGTLFKLPLGSFSLASISSKAQGYLKSITGTLSLSSISGKLVDFYKSLSLSINMQTISGKISSVYKSLTGSISIQALSLKFTGFYKSLAVSFNLSSLSGRFSIISRYLSQGLSISSAMTKISGFYKAVTSNFSLASLIAKFSTMQKNVSSLISLQSISGKFIIIYKSLQQSITSNAITGKAISFFKGISQSLQLNSVTARMLSLIRAPSQSLSLSLAAIRSQLFTVRIFSSFSMSDLAAGIRTIGFQTFDRIASLAVSMTGSMTRILSSIRASLTGFSLNAMSSKLILNVRSITGNLSLSGLAESTKAFVKSLSQSLSLSSITARFYIVQKTIASSVNLQAISGRFSTLHRSLSQSLSVSLATVRSQLLNARVFSSFSLSDLAAGIKAVGPQTFDRVASLAVSVTGNMVKILNTFRTLISSFSMNSIISKFPITLRNLQQSFSLNAVTAKTISIFRGITQSLQLNSVTARLLLIIRVPSQYLSVSLSAIRSQLFTAKVFSSFSMSDFSTGMFAIGEQTYNRAVSLVLSVTGNMTKILTNIRTLTQTVNLRIITGRITSFFRFIALRFNFLFSLFQQKTVSPPFSSNTVYVQANVSETVNTTGITNSTIELLANATIGSITVNTTLFTNSPVSNISEIPLKHLNLTVSPILNETNLKWAIIKIHYTDEELSALSLEENSLSMYRYNTSSQTWTKLTTSLNFVYGTGVNTSSNYVWANVSSFSLYAIGGLKANSKSCSANTECYSGLCCSGICQSACPTGITSAGGVSGGGGMALNITPMPTVNIEFSKTPVLREVAPGQSIVAGIVVRNKGNSTLSGLHIEISGIPQEWVTVVPKSLNLDPDKSGGFSIGISVPDSVAFGDYKTVVTLKNEIMEDRSFFVLRVKSHTTDQDKPFVIRTVEIDKLEGKTNVELDVYNPSGTWSYADLVEYIPKQSANSTDFVEFKTNPSEIIQKDPIVSWRMFNLTEGDTRKIYYSTSNILEEFTPYIYWPLRELNLARTKPVSNLEIVDLKIPNLIAGRSSIATLTIRNLDNNTHAFGFDLKLPSDWKTEPKNITEVIKGMEKRDFMLSIIVPDKTSPGYYVARGEFLWDDGMIIKEYRVEVVSFNYWNAWILIFASIIIIVAVVIFYYCMKKIRIKMYFRKLKEQYKDV